MLTDDPYERTLLDAITANPEALGHREAYADWVEAHAGSEGLARATFIRLQIKRHVDGQSVPSFLMKESRLLTEARKSAWAEGIDAWARFPMYYRGFVECVTLDARDFVDHWRAIVTRVPLRHVDLKDAGPVMDALANCPGLGHLRTLSFSRNRLTDQHLQTFLATPWATSLRALELSGNDLTESGVEALCAVANDRFPHLVDVGWDSSVDPRAESEHAGHGVEVPVHVPPLGERLRAAYPDVKWLFGLRSGLDRFTLG